MVVVQAVEMLVNTGSLKLTVRVLNSSSSLLKVRESKQEYKASTVWKDALQAFDNNFIQSPSKVEKGKGSFSALA